jgi:multiple sugar transport system substrate-binding protein
MKKVFLSFSALVILVIFAGCGASGTRSNGTALSPDFFDSKIEGQITISAYDSMSYRTYLEEAVRSFEALYPGTKVNIETFSAMSVMSQGIQGDWEVYYMEYTDEPQSRQDYLSRINTSLMSGSGADIYAMDILPLHKYVESKMLENLEPYMNLDPGFNKLDYRQNILEALRYKDGTWFMPMDYSFNYYTYDSTLVPAQIASGFGIDKAFVIEDLLKNGITMFYTEGTHQLFEMDWRAVLNQLLDENIQSFINMETRQANFVDGRFTGLLNSVRDYAEQGYIPQGYGQRSIEEQIQDSITVAPTDRYYFKQESYNMLTYQIMRKFPLVREMMGIPQFGSAIADDDEIAGIQAIAGGLVPFTYGQGFAINSQSKNKAVAWAFIKYLLSYEMQTNPRGGSPIHNEAIMDVEDVLEQLMGITNQQRQALINFFVEYKATMEKLSESINTFVVQDTSLNDMIRPEVQYFFDGRRSAEEVARVLQNRAELYLSE